jgi:pSer/pThr/pTyr-binding forkhead associated (FHA) protein
MQPNEQTRLTSHSSAPDIRSHRLWIRANGVEFPLAGGQVLIGRGEQCGIRIKENLVSRRHARITIEGAQIVLEDLGSANGVFVNHQRVVDSVLLNVGDHIFIGTCELVVFEDPGLDERITDPGDSSDGDPGRKTPVGAVNHSAVIYPTQSVHPGAQFTVEDTIETERATHHQLEFDYLGRLADKMFTMGRTDAAKQILESRLEDILSAARLGEPLDPALVDCASSYALRLGSEALDSHFVDLAVELHLHARRPMIERNAQYLATLRAKAPLGNVDLLRRYTRILQGMMAGLGPAERIIAQRISCLVPEPGGE